MMSNDVLGTGIVVQGSSDGTVIEGNRPGTNLTRTVALPNKPGISVEQWPSTGAPLATRIGGSGAGEGDAVDFSYSVGVTVGPTGSIVTISGNSIHDNGGLGISLSGTR